MRHTARRLRKFWAWASRRQFANDNRKPPARSYYLEFVTNRLLLEELLQKQKRTNELMDQALEGRARLDEVRPPLAPRGEALVLARFTGEIASEKRSE